MKGDTSILEPKDGLPNHFKGTEASEGAGTYAITLSPWLASVQSEVRLENRLGVVSFHWREWVLLSQLSFAEMVDERSASFSTRQNVGE